jgi:hypothetical protein
MRRLLYIRLLYVAGLIWVFLIIRILAVVAERQANYAMDRDIRETLEHPVWSKEIKLQRLEQMLKNLHWSSVECDCLSHMEKKEKREGAILHAISLLNKGIGKLKLQNILLK